MNIKLIFVCLFALTITSVSPESFADDWPQINGPNRNGITTDEELLKTWPKAGLTEVWSHPVGQGYSGPVVVGEKLIIFHRPGRSYLVEALNAKTGKLIWNRELESVYQAGGPDPDNGPKAVPLIHKKHIYLFGTGGNLFCLKLSDGSVVWQKDVLDIYSSPSGYFGAGSTPIVLDEKLLVNVGGKDAGVVAFDLKTGKELWKTFDDRASYSSPIEFKLKDKSLAVFVTRLNCAVIDPKDGKVLGKIPFGRSGATVNGAMPVNVMDNKIFLNSAYGVGLKVFTITEGKIAASKQNPNDQFASQYSTPVALDGAIYGTSGREDVGDGSFRCVDLNGPRIKVAWTQERFPVGHSILVGNQIVVLDCKGGFHVIEANRTKFNRVYQTKLFDTDARSIPAISNGLFYARSNAVRGKGELVCVEVGRRGKE